VDTPNGQSDGLGSQGFSWGAGRPRRESASEHPSPLGPGRSVVGWGLDFLRANGARWSLDIFRSTQVNPGADTGRSKGNPEGCKTVAGGRQGQLGRPPGSQQEVEFTPAGVTER
jgi:hypothetical protein